MNNKAVLAIIIGILLVGGAIYLQQKNSNVPTESETPVAEEGSEGLENGSYVVANSESSLLWKGRKTLIANYEDSGTLDIKEGSVNVNDGEVSGTFVFDMTTIKATSTGKGMGEDMLSKHLQSEDFFDVAVHPTATFALKSAVPEADVQSSHRYQVTGDLTIKNITHEASFPAVIYMKDGDLHTEATTELDRTLWDIRYGSGQFFDNLANNVIDDKFVITFDVVARN